MQNIDLSIENEILIIKVDLSKSAGFTRSRRSICVGTSEGNLGLWQDGRPRPEYVNINVFRKRPRKEWMADDDAQHYFATRR